MSQRALEAALGRLVCDEGFRRDVYADAETATARAGFRLTRVEFNSLRKIEPATLNRFAAQLDDRVRRAEEPVLPLLR